MFRNFAVYQRLDTLIRTTWIFISIPSSLKNQLEHVLLGRKLSGFGTVLWRLAFLAEAVRGWREYINFLDVKLQEMVRDTLYIFQKPTDHLLAIHIVGSRNIFRAQMYRKA